MTNAFSLFRSLVIYGVCLPLAIFIGYLLATPTDFSTYASVGLFLGLMTIPLFLRWHYPWLLLTWNASAGLYFLPGKPSLVMPMAAASFAISMLSYIMNRNLKFINVPSITRPLIFLLVVVFGTARLTGGIGLNVIGSEGVGGKRYIYILVAVLGFFALTAQSIPARKVGLYVNLFYLGGLSAAVGNLASIVTPSFYFIFLIFPGDTAGMATFGPDTGVTITRLGGLAVASIAIISWLLARYGIRGVLDMKKCWRFLLFAFFMVVSLFGGFRSMLIQLALTCGILFCLEGLLRSRLLPIMILAGILFAALVVPFANKMPLAVQRSLTFLPLDLDVEAELSSKGSTEWRLEMWKNVLPLVPQYLILGKGYIMDAVDFDMNEHGMTRGADVAYGAALAGDYHNGPLSVIIPFGIFGVVGFVWFLVAGFRLLHRNYKFGDPEYQNINRFLYTYFIVKTIMFVVIIGSLYSDLIMFLGPLGLSIALNGGLRSPVLEPVKQQVMNRFRLAGAAR